MKRFLSIVLSLIAIFATSITAFSSNNSTAYPFSENIVYYSEVTNDESPSYSEDSIIVMTESDALELGTKLQKLAKRSDLIYITGDVNPITISKAAGLPSPGQTENTDKNDDVRNIAITIDFMDGQFFIQEISVKSSDLDNLVNNKSSSITLDGINSALYKGSKENVNDDEVEALDLPSGFDKYSDKSTIVYDDDNNNIGTMRFNARYYDRGKWTSGYMFDTIVTATFAPTENNQVKKVSVTLGHTDTGKGAHKIIDETYIPSSDIGTTYELGLSASPGASASWSYSSEAVDVVNSFAAEDERVWKFEIISPRGGNAFFQEPGIRSVAESSSDKYTTITLSCPFYNIFGGVAKENFLKWNILW